MSIRVMDPVLVAQIKAGEVIERPASAAKELIENALDAGARRIRIEILEGGTRLIRVVDDGNGIDPTELALAFAEHTSSKLHSPDGLGNIETLGFRGEALHAIANVARVEAVSCLQGGQQARSVLLENGQILQDEPAAAGGGTRIAIYDLFAKVPARRKHLRSARSEAAAIHQVVAQYAIGHPVTAVTVISEGRPVLTSPGTGRIEDAFASVYGADLVDRMSPIHQEGAVTVSGLVSAPSLTRSNRTAVLVLVNGRPVRSPALIFAIEDAYSGLLMAGRHPLAVVAITLPSDQLDPNVHPAKLEVRFLAERAVFAAVREAVGRALASADHVSEPKEWLDDWLVGPTDVSIPEQPRRHYPDQVSFEGPPPSPAAPPSLSQALPSLRVFGQSSQTFIIAEGPAGLYVIDQHAAHERVLFDSLTNRLNGNLSQPLLDPARLELTAEQWSALDTHSTDLQSLGFGIEPFGDRWCTVRALPHLAKTGLDPEVVPEVLDALSEARSAEDIINRATTVVACKAAVKAGRSLSLQEMRELVTQLEKTEHPRTCPHGRPTTIHISTERLEREFGRR